MIVPLIAATLRDALAATPVPLREAGLGQGATPMEVVRRILLPAQRRVLIGATILALGRALGETMAVLMVSGNALNILPGNIYDPISTMAAFIASQLDSALQDPTGILLALAIALGETAPLLYTAGWSNYLWNGDFTHESMAYLTYVIWSFIGEPYPSAHRLAYAAALLITLLVLAINLAAWMLLWGRRR
jgi:ABC-type phosphate transport system permease subunit